MKKIIFIFICIFQAFPAFAQIQPPPWSEFCPAAYVNSQYSNYQGMSGAKNFFMLISLFGTAKAIEDKKQKTIAKTQNYWTNRREEYEQELAQCRLITDKNILVQSYLQIQRIEYEKNFDITIDELETQIKQTQQSIESLKKENRNLVDELLWVSRRY